MAGTLLEGCSPLRSMRTRARRAKRLPDWYLDDQMRLFGYVEGPVGELVPGLSPARRALIARSLFSAVHGIVTLGLEEKLQAFKPGERRRKGDATSSLRAKRSNPGQRARFIWYALDCFVALRAPRNDGYRLTSAACAGCLSTTARTCTITLSATKAWPSAVGWMAPL
jgi:hypothetical protein